MLIYHMRTTISHLLRIEVAIPHGLIHLPEPEGQPLAPYL
jgi:hypothetical protein